MRKPHQRWVLGSARVISVLGHPLILVPLFLATFTLHRYSAGRAALLTGAVVGGIVLPLAAWNLWRVRQGRYTNFDVSNRQERHSMYPVLLGMMGTVSAIGWLTRQPRSLVIGLTVAFGMVAVAALINRRLKCSLHAAIAFFLAGAMVVLTGATGLLAVVLAVLVAVSRVILGRHDTPEVLIGAALGLLGAGLTWWLA